jgi:hypothetical protein
MRVLKQALCLSLVAIGAVIPVQADSCSQEDWCQWNGCWRLGAELLYWQPCVCEWDAGLGSTFPEDDIDSTILTIKPSADFGFRLIGGYDSEDGCEFATLSWTHLRSTDAWNVPPFSITTFGIDQVTDLALGVKSEYNRVSLQAGRYLYQGCGANFYTVAGLDFIDFDLKRSANYVASSTFAEYFEKSEYYGLGFELGLGGEYHIGCGFNLAGKVGAVASFGRRKHRSAFPQDPLFQEYPSTTLCIPGLDVRVGINYARECNCNELTLELGFALDYYWQPLAVGMGANFSRSECIDVGFGGPYLAFQLRF